MKTKHLFYTMALAASLGACTNDEFLTDASIESHKADRPVISNVSLEVENVDADTRLEYVTNKGLQWQNGDKIAAMLMDENNTGVRYGSATNTEKWNKLSWLQKYHLVDYVHTNFAFEYDDEEGIWRSTGDCNMLEGNYFLAYPYVSFDGKRQAYYNIGTQKQVGNTPEARMKAFAENQKFVGYAQLEATEEGAKLSTKLAGLLASVQIKIQSNVGDVPGEPLTVNKIVLANKNFSSHYSIDPTRAEYGVWNLKKKELNHAGWDKNIGEEEKPEINYFNYANYLDATGLKNCKNVDLYRNELFGSVSDKDYVYNIEEGKVGNVEDLYYDVNPDYNTRKIDEYYWDEALRKVVKPLNKGNWTENTTNYIEVYTYGEDGTSPMLLETGKEKALGIWAMIPPYDITDYDQDDEDKEVELYIYTNKGVVGPVDLSKIHDGNTGGSVVTDNALLKAHPNMKTQKITVKIDADDIIAVNPSMKINNEDDLRNFVEWAKNSETSAFLEVELTNDVTIDDNLAAAIGELKNSGHGILFIKGREGKNANVKLAVKDSTKILEYIDMEANALVQVVNGATVDLTSAAHNLWAKDAESAESNKLNIYVEKGGVLNIVDSNKPGVDGWGSNSNVAKYCDVELTNEGGLINVNAKVAKNAGILVKNEEGEMVVNGNSQIILAPGSKNELKGVITIQEGGELSGTTEGNVKNYGDIYNGGELYNVTNSLAKSGVANQNRVRPGYVYITNVDAQTILTENKGKVIYKVLPNTPVEVKVGEDGKDPYSYIFLYESAGKDILASKLAAAHVTDLVLNGGTLLVDKARVNSNLRHLTVVGGTVKKDPNLNISGAPQLGFADATTEEVLLNAAWNDGTNKVTLRGSGTTVEDVKFWNINGTTDEACVFLEKNPEEKENALITFKKEVQFAAANSTYAIVDLNAVTLKAEDKSNVTVKKFTAVKEVSSTIKVVPGGQMTATETNKDLKYDKKFIVVTAGEIK